MKFVSRGQTSSREKAHRLNPLQESPQGFLTVGVLNVIIERLDDEPDTLRLTQRQFVLGFENAVREDSLGDLSHSVSLLP